MNNQLQNKVGEKVIFCDGARVIDGNLLEHTGERLIATVLELPNSDGDYLIEFEDNEGGKQVCRTPGVYLCGKYQV